MIDYRESAPRIKRIAWIVMRQLHAAGARSITRDDVEQELWIAWCKARDTFDASQNVPFQAYMIEGLKRYVRWDLRRKLLNRINDEWTETLDSPDEDEGSMHDQIASDEPEIGHDYEERSHLEHVSKRISPEAATFLRLLYDQPTLLLDQLLQLESRSRHAESIGVDFVTPRHLTTAIVFKVMGVNRLERTKILKEVRKLGALMQRKMA
jgi:DNA-directed RNA polymerase specialized sigma24 family protein